MFLIEIFFLSFGYRMISVNRRLVVVRFVRGVLVALLLNLFFVNGYYVE